MDSLLDRLAALDAARLVALAGALLILLLDAAFVVSAVAGHWEAGPLAAAVVATLSAGLGLL